MTYRRRLAIAFFAVSVLTAAAVLWQAWRRGRELQLAGLRALLRTTASVAVDGLDGDAHARVRWGSPEAERDPTVGALRERLDRVRASDARFLEVWTLTIVDAPEPGFGRLALGSGSATEATDAGAPYDMRRFPAMLRGLEGPSADDTVVTDEYGTTLSGYAPIRDRAGRAVGVLGIDVDASTVEAMRHDLLVVLGASGLAGMLLAGALAFVFARRVSRPVSRLAEGMDAVASGDFAMRLAAGGNDEFARLFTQFDRMASGLEDRQRLKQSMLLAMEIQRHLLPGLPPRVAGVDLAGRSDYCDETGGDYFDYPRTWPLPGGRVALTVGDVTGHGIGAALLMATGRAVLRSHADHDHAPAALVSLVNRNLARDALSGRFMTLFYGVLDPEAGTLEYANGGQGGCFLYRRAADRFETLPAGAPPLGVFADATIPQARVEGIVPGDLVVLATDGVWETIDAAGEAFGFARMEATVRAAAAAGGSAQDVLDALFRAATAHRGDGPQADDVTCVVAKLGAPAVAAHDVARRE